MRRLQHKAAVRQKNATQLPRKRIIVWRKKINYKNPHVVLVWLF